MKQTGFKDCDGEVINFNSKIYFLESGTKGTIFPSKREGNKGQPVIRWSDGFFDLLEQYHKHVRVYFE